MALFFLAALCWSACAQAADETACATEIAAAERSLPVPPRVLHSIAVVESGRVVAGRMVPWPWSVNVGGVSHYYASKAEAIGEVEALRSAGLQSIDVGCMQVNLASHPAAFRSLEEAFDPGANVAYAARFFMSLYQQTGRWSLAMTSYHSHTPSLAADYARRLLAVWPGAATYGLGEGGRDPAARDTSGSERNSALSPAALPVHGRAWPTAGLH